MGRFLRGFLIGAPLGAAIVLLVTPTSGRVLIQGITTHITTAVEAGKAAAALHEQQMWAHLRSQLKSPADDPADRAESRPAAEGEADADAPPT
ncbi:MAG: hypothetical protein HC884_10015 [Chloroflexaceae bacterium]|nr:hypothetical protein [Chloroflexaceae bacterium]